jgi:MoxR-like ATPase
MDRFILRMRIDYPSPEDERRLLLETPGKAGESLAALTPVLLPRDVVTLQEAADRVKLSSELAEFIVAVARDTRESPFVTLGVSPRGQLAWRNLARASALADGRDFVIPDDLKSTALPALAHRLVLASHAEPGRRAREEAERVVSELLGRFPIPG